MDQFTRVTELIGQAKSAKLKKAKVIVFGVGGVGGFVIEALVRSGIENITIVDNDVVDITNLNRQIIADHQTLGISKVHVMKERILRINPKAEVISLQKFLTTDNINEFEIENYDYIIDAIDTVSAKISLVCKAKEKNIRIISSLGTGNKLEPSLLKVGDIYETKICPLAKVVRKELRKLGVEELNVVYSTEEPIKTGARTPSSMMMVPATAGLMIASKVIRELINIDI